MIIDKTGCFGPAVGEVRSGLLGVVWGLRLLDLTKLFKNGTRYDASPFVSFPTVLFFDYILKKGYQKYPF